DSAVAFSKGRLTAITRAGQSVGYRYDRFGRVTQDGALVYAYDDNGNRTEIGYPGGVTATYTHDYGDRQETLTLEDGSNPSQPVVTAAAYKPSGPLTGLTLGNGLAETRDYDQRYFPQRIHVAGLLDWTYTTDAVGNILSITDAEDPTGTRTYGYQDVHYFLTRGDGPWGELSWTYDRIGNRLSETRDGEANVYQYLGNTAGGHNPKLTEINPGTEDSIRYFYDAAGNQTYRSEGATKQRFSYDAARRLSQILTDSPETAGAMSQFRYDGRSFLDTATLTPFPGRPEQLTTSATYSSEGLLHHRSTEEPRGPASPRNAPDRLTQSFVLTFAGRPVGIYEKVDATDLEGQISEATSLIYLTTDHLGTPVLATDPGRSKIWGGGFEPFGSEFSEAQQAGVFLRFPGQWENVAWGGASDGESLYYNVHRWYESGTSRYSRPDPAGVLRPGREALLEANHLYSYAASNPLFFVDLLGLDVEFGEPWLKDRYNQLKQCFKWFNVLMGNHFEVVDTVYTVATDPPGDECSFPDLNRAPNTVFVLREGPERGSPQDNCSNTIRCLVHEFYERWLIDVGGHPPSQMATGSADRMARRAEGWIPPSCCSCEASQ
ncbi:MAG: RHS repeat-associated core domain-containing protein, partial [Thermoanaerobaculia bacterium]